MRKYSVTFIAILILQVNLCLPNPVLAFLKGEIINREVQIKDLSKDSNRKSNNAELNKLILGEDLLQVAANADSDTTLSLSDLNDKALDSLYSSPQRANELASKALALAKKTGDKAEEALACNILGLVSDNQGSYDKAIFYYLRSLDIYEELGDKESAGIALNNIGQFYQGQGNKALALKYLNQALAYANDTNDKLNKGYIYNNLGLIYDDEGNFKKALNFYRRSIKMYEEVGDSVEQAIPLHNISWLYLSNDEFDSALHYVNKAYNIDIELNDPEGLAADYNLMGEIYKEQGDYARAITYYNKSLVEASKNQTAPLLLETYNGISSTYFLNRKFDKALDYLEQYALLQDSIYNETSFQEIVTTQARFDATLQQKELSLLQSQKELDALTLTFRKTFTILLLGSGTTLFFALVLLFWQNRSTMKVNHVLNDQIKTINKQNQSLEHYNKELEDSKHKLKEFNETKDKFFSIISHDLKSPLNSLTGLTQLLTIQSDSLTKDELLHLSKMLQYSIANLSELLENLLQWSMSQMGRINQTPSKVNLNALVKENIALLKLNAEAKNITVTSNIDPLSSAYADPNMVSFIVRNLLSNAIKFTPKGGKVELRTEASGNQICLVVEDNGVGISPDNINKLFNIQRNFTTQGTAKEKGTGLGLILCKEFVEKNNGEITVESTLENGTRFSILLPKYFKENNYSHRDN